MQAREPFGQRGARLKLRAVDLRNKLVGASWLHERVRELLPPGWEDADEDAPDPGELGCLCPICDAEFAAYGPFNRRQNAACPSCGSLERHRASWIFLKHHTDFLRRRVRMLHFAPEGALTKALSQYCGIEQVAARYDPGKPDEGIDIQRLPFEDESFELIHCSHVLEHVPDDLCAMREMLRVLKPGGMSLVMIPIRSRPKTEEDPSITDPEERTRLFGQHDHLRYYGRDVVDRLTDAGFDLRIENVWDRFEPKDRARYGLKRETIFACWRPE